MSLAELAKCLIPIYKFTANGLSIAMLDFLGNLIAIVRKPAFMIVQHLNGLGNEFINRAIGAAFHILLNE